MEGEHIGKKQKIKNNKLIEHKDENKLKEEFEIKRKVRNVSVGIPTKDSDIKDVLRLLKEPICLFGEDNYDRRNRLKRVLSDKYDKLIIKENYEYIEEVEEFRNILKEYYIDLSSLYDFDTVKQKKVNELEEELKKKELEKKKKTQITEADQIQGKFYTESTTDLIMARLRLCVHTLSRITKHKVMMNKFQNQYTKNEFKHYITSYNEHLKQNIELYISQLGDERPLTMGKFSPDNKFFAVSSYNTYINIFNYRNDDYNKIKCLSDGHTDKVNYISWNYPHNYSYYNDTYCQNIQKEQLLLASCSSDKSYCLWKPFIENDNIKDNKKNLLSRVIAHDDRINKIIFHPFNNYIMTCSEDETIKFFDIETEKELFYQEGHNTNVYTVEINTHGNLYLSGDSKGGIMLWDLRTGRNINRKQMIHNKCIMNINFNPFFSNFFCTCSADNTIKIFDLRKFNMTYNLLAHNKMVTDILYEPIYGRYLASTSFDTSIKIWDTINYYCSKILYNNDNKVKNIDISTNGDYLATTSFDRTWKLYKKQPFQKPNIISTFM